MRSTKQNTKALIRLRERKCRSARLLLAYNKSGTPSDNKPMSVSHGVAQVQKSSTNTNYTHAYIKNWTTGPRSAVGNVSGNRCESDCRSRGREFDPGPVPYFRGD